MKSSVVQVAGNVPCYDNSEKVFSEDEFIHGHLLRLSLYGPMLNTIEYVWSTFEAAVKQVISELLPEIEENRVSLSQIKFSLR